MKKAKNMAMQHTGRRPRLLNTATWRRSSSVAVTGTAN